MRYRNFGAWVITFACLCGAPGPRAAAEPAEAAAAAAGKQRRGKLKTVKFMTYDVSGKHVLEVTLTAGKVNEALLLLLQRGLRVELIHTFNRKDLRFWEDDPHEPNANAAEVRIDVRPVQQPPEGQRFVWTWPEAFEMARSGIVTVRPDYPGIRPAEIVALPTLPPPGDKFRHLSGSLVCEAPDGPATVLHPIPYVQVRVGDRQVAADAAGAFNLAVDFDEIPATLRLLYDSRVGAAGTPVTPLSIMDDFHNARSEDVTLPPPLLVFGDTVVLPPIVVQGGDCEIWRIGAATLEEYHASVGAVPPTGRLRIKRWAGVVVGGIYAFYDYVVLRTDFVGGVAPTQAHRIETMRHEFGHTLRHFADGDEYHWNWDNFRWVYARYHDGTEITSMHYAFNEGWGQYWAAASQGVPAPAGTLDPAYLDWNETRIGDRLLQLGAPGAATRAQMVQVLTGNPGTIHTLWEFEQAYCALIGSNPHCAGGMPLRTPPDDCPDDFINDGLFCRFNNIRVKDSYGRGVGTVPTECGVGNENDAGLCYPVCRPGFNGVLTGCYAFCPDGYADHGLTCWRDGHIFPSDNSSCDFWDACGLTFDRGCSVCPPGYHNDGCFCRRDPHVFSKEIYDRGAGWIPTMCSGGMQYDAGLCYTPCSAGFTGVGPVCWGSCPAGFADHGATCYAPPNVFTRY